MKNILVRMAGMEIKSAGVGGMGVISVPVKVASL